MNEPLGHRKDCPSYKATAQNEPTDEEIRKELLENPKLGEGDDKDVFTKCARYFYRKGQQDTYGRGWQDAAKAEGWKSPEEWALKRIDEDCADENRAYLKKKIAELEAALERARQQGHDEACNLSAHDKWMREQFAEVAEKARKEERENTIKNGLAYLSFITEQMKDRKSDEEGKIGKTERYTNEYMVLIMCWQEFARIFFGFYPALDGMPPLGSGKNNELLGAVLLWQEDKKEEAVAKLKAALRGEKE